MYQPCMQNARLERGERERARKDGYGDREMAVAARARSDATLSSSREHLLGFIYVHAIQSACHTHIHMKIRGLQNAGRCRMQGACVRVFYIGYSGPIYISLESSLDLEGRVNRVSVFDA
jgi:hypothetical protein